MRVRVDSARGERPDMDSERWHRVAHVYESVLDRNPGERAAFLSEATAGDKDLRREVESLLAHDSVPC
jgi:hypothetical protein